MDRRALIFGLLAAPFAPKAVAQAAPVAAWDEIEPNLWKPAVAWDQRVV